MRTPQLRASSPLGRTIREGRRRPPGRLRTARPGSDRINTGGDFPSGAAPEHGVLPDWTARADTFSLTDGETE